MYALFGSLGLHEGHDSINYLMIFAFRFLRSFPLRQPRRRLASVQRAEAAKRQHIRGEALNPATTSELWLSSFSKYLADSDQASRALLLFTYRPCR